MNDSSMKVRFEDLDLFSLLRLEHLSAEEKAERIAEIQSIVLTDFFQEDLQKLLSLEDLNKFEAIASDASKRDEVNKFLQEKIPNFENIILEKMLVAKKEIVRQNMQSRLDVNEKESTDSEVQQNDARMRELSEEKEKLDKIVSSVDSDDWDTASGLIRTL